MPEFDSGSFSPLHYSRLMRTHLEDLERALNLMEVSYKMRLSALGQELDEDFDKIRQQIRYLQNLS